MARTPLPPNVVAEGDQFRANTLAPTKRLVDIAAEVVDEVGPEQAPALLAAMLLGIRNLNSDRLVMIASNALVLAAQKQPKGEVARVRSYLEHLRGYDPAASLDAGEVVAELADALSPRRGGLR